jgi:hypothetical protein
MYRISKQYRGARLLALGLGFAALASLVTVSPTWVSAQQKSGKAPSPFPGGTNPDGSLRPSPPLNRLFAQDAYTEYAILEPGSEQFRVMFMPEETTVGATELVNATRGGSEGSDIEVFDPRSGNPIKFTYLPISDDPGSHAIHAALPIPVPEGGVGRVLIYKTYKDARTYMLHGDDLVWVRGLSAQRFSVILPKGYSFISSNIASQMSVTGDGRLKLSLTNPSGGGSPITIHAHKTTASFTPFPYADTVFDDIKTLYDLGAPDSHAIQVEQIYSESRKGDHCKLDSLAYLKLQDVKVIDLDTAKNFVVSKSGSTMVAKLDVPIVNDKQSAHLKITGTLNDPGYKIVNGQLVFERTLHGLRNTVLLPAGWEVSGVSQAGTVGIYKGRAFVALINLNAEDQYLVTIHASKK